MQRLYVRLIHRRVLDRHGFVKRQMPCCPRLLERACFPRPKDIVRSNLFVKKFRTDRLGGFQGLGTYAL